MLRSRIGRVAGFAVLFTSVVTHGMAQAYPPTGAPGYAPPGQQATNYRSLLQRLMNPQAGNGYPPYQQPYQQPTYAQPYGQQAYPQTTYPPPYTLQPSPAQQQSDQQSAAGAQAEAAARRDLMLHSMGFGGLFGPALKKWVETPPQPGSGGN